MGDPREAARARAYDDHRATTVEKLYEFQKGRLFGEIVLKIEDGMVRRWEVKKVTLPAADRT